ncbi:MAG: hypothetical protein A2Z14_04030 [Chloroflexi bacterium RBG_16_48_8]|nr:MAG: hypothetical protein A2Z14_04030 [Chloroflexi bacterium RBG_16_48_8]
MRSYSSAKFFRGSIICLILVLIGCSRGDVPLLGSPTTETPAVSEETQLSPTITPAAQEKYPLQREYAAVWASIEDGFNVRNQAGISAAVVEVIPWDSHQIYLTGNRSLLGSSLWLEIKTEGGATGWVNAWNLTEYVPSGQFCEDSRVHDLLDDFRQALLSPEDLTLMEFISPNRGLSIRLNWYGPDVTFSVDKVDSIFTDVSEFDWGTMADSGLQVMGSFEKIIQPKLEDVFSGASEVLCNELNWGSTAGEVLWPDEIENINFYAFYRPAEENGNEFSWRTWAVGIEYVNDQPFIAILVHYSSEL